MNTYVRDNVAALFGGRSCQLNMAVAFSVPDSAWTVCNFTNASSGTSPEQWDVFAGSANGFYDKTSSLSRLTIPSGGAGIYRVEVNLHFVANNTGARAGGIRINGAGGERYLVNQAAPAAGGHTGDLCFSSTFNASATDYVEVLAFQSSGGALNLSTGTLVTINYLGQPS